MNFGKGWTGDFFIIDDWHDIESDVASEVYVKWFKSKEVGIKKLQQAFICPCADASVRQGGHTQRETLSHQRVESFGAGRSTLHFGRGEE